MDFVVLSGQFGEMGVLDVREVLSDVTRSLGQEIGSSRDEEERRECQTKQNVPCNRVLLRKEIAQ